MEGATPAPRDKETDYDSVKGRYGLNKTFDAYEPTSSYKKP